MKPSKIIRKSSCTLKFSTASKRQTLSKIFDEYTKVTNIIIDHLWNLDTIFSTYVSKDQMPVLDTWLSARLIQCSSKQALAMLKSVINKHKKTKSVLKKPMFKGRAMELDQRFIDIQEGKNTFDLWVKLTSIGNKIKIILPIKKHKHFNLFYDDKNFNISRSVKIRDSGVIDFYFETERIIKQEGKALAFDMGINSMLVSSDNQVFGKNLKKYINNILNKVTKSKAWKKSITELHNYIDCETNKISLKGIKTFVIEDLTGITLHTKKRVSKTTRRLIGHWNYRYLVNRILNLCTINGVEVTFVNPKYTSQTCRQCNHIHKSNRSGELFKCIKCGYSGNADYLASLNILDLYNRGAYSLSCKA